MANVASCGMGAKSAGPERLHVGQMQNPLRFAFDAEERLGDARLLVEARDRSQRRHVVEPDGFQYGGNLRAGQRQGNLLDRLDVDVRDGREAFDRNILLELRQPRGGPPAARFSRASSSPSPTVTMK